MTIELPKDLIDRGFKLIAVAPGELFAVSPRWGCTGVKATLAEVVKEARSLISYLEWRERKAREIAAAELPTTYPIEKHRLFGFDG